MLLKTGAFVTIGVGVVVKVDFRRLLKCPWDLARVGADLEEHVHVLEHFDPFFDGDGRNLQVLGQIEYHNR